MVGLSPSFIFQKKLYYKVCLKQATFSFNINEPQKAGASKLISHSCAPVPSAWFPFHPECFVFLLFFKEHLHIHCRFVHEYNTFETCCDFQMDAPVGDTDSVGVQTLQVQNVYRSTWLMLASCKSKMGRALRDGTRCLSVWFCSVLRCWVGGLVGQPQDCKGIKGFGGIRNADTDLETGGELN